MLQPRFNAVYQGILDQALLRLLPAGAAQTYYPVAIPPATIRFGGDPEEDENSLLKQQIADVWKIWVQYETRTGHPEAAAAWEKRLRSW